VGARLTEEKGKYDAERNHQDKKGDTPIGFNKEDYIAKHEQEKYGIDFFVQHLRYILLQRGFG